MRIMSRIVKAEAEWEEEEEEEGWKEEEEDDW